VGCGSKSDPLNWGEVELKKNGDPNGTREERETQMRKLSPQGSPGHSGKTGHTHASKIPLTNEIGVIQKGKTIGEEEDHRVLGR